MFSFFPLPVTNSPLYKQAINNSISYFETVQNSNIVLLIPCQVVVTLSGERVARSNRQTILQGTPSLWIALTLSVSPRTNLWRYVLRTLTWSLLKVSCDTTRVSWTLFSLSDRGQALWLFLTFIRGNFGLSIIWSCDLTFLWHFSGPYQAFSIGFLSAIWKFKPVIANRRRLI